jgi:hypothetical protein
MEKTVYILQNINLIDQWGVFKTLQEAKDAKWNEVCYFPDSQKEEQDKKWVIITKEI